LMFLVCKKYHLATLQFRHPSSTYADNKAALSHDSECRESQTQTGHCVAWVCRPQKCVIEFEVLNVGRLCETIWYEIWDYIFLLSSIDSSQKPKLYFATICSFNRGSSSRAR
jgi:hypothetical protein